MTEPTLDVDIVILSRETGPTPSVRYQRVSTGEQWLVSGVCNQCGLCVVGAAVTTDYVWLGPPGTPLAVIDLRYGTRLDEPVAVGFVEDMQQAAAITPTATVAGCSLTIEGLE